jgi:hypothetical protein
VALVPVFPRIQLSPKAAASPAKWGLLVTLVSAVWITFQRQCFLQAVSGICLLVVSLACQDMSCCPTFAAHFRYRKMPHVQILP